MLMLTGRTADVDGWRREPAQMKNGTAADRAEFLAPKTVALILPAPGIAHVPSAGLAEELHGQRAARPTLKGPKDRLSRLKVAKALLTRHCNRS